MKPRWFVLESIDPETECVAGAVSFQTEDLAALNEIVDPEAADADFRNGYDLTIEDVARIKKHVGVRFEPGPFPVFLRLARKTDELPYQVHTRRELALMLKGTKPLAYFSATYPPNADDLQPPERLFDPHVDRGTFVKREYVLLDDALTERRSNVRGLRVVLYALAHEAWRIDALILLQATATRSGWNEGFERMMGSLLGYEEWQNDAFIALQKQYPYRDNTIPDR